MSAVRKRKHENLE